MTGRKIRSRLVTSYLLLIVLTVLLFESIILSALRFYYVEGVRQTLLDQGNVFASFHEQTLPERELAANATAMMQEYDFPFPVRSQLVSADGKVLADTHAASGTAAGSAEDVQAALSGSADSMKHHINGEAVYSVSVPLLADDQVVGAIRLTTSMKQINHAFFKNATALLATGGLVILIAACVSYFLANTITKPVRAMTDAAVQMASGKFSTRITKEKNDELGKLADTLNFMAEEAEKHEQLKNEFIASVSHELRTPLTSVKGWAVTLHSMSDDAIFKEGLEIISSESDRLSHLLGELLDLSSLSAGKAVYLMEKILLHELLHQVIIQVSPRAGRQGIALAESYLQQPIISGDSDRLKQVFLNVIDNALKFTDTDGTVSVLLRVEECYAILEISDTGIGIPADELQLVKEKFYKGKLKNAGTGLGLAVCEEILTAHHGTFELTSDSQGTTVRIVFPVLS